MRRFASRVPLALFVVIGAVALPLMAQTQMRWIRTGSDAHNYQVQGSGDPLDAQGATVSVHAEHADPDKNGGSMRIVDATPYRGRTVMLATDLDTHDAVKGAIIWLRVDGGKEHLALANSQMMPVNGTATAHREIQLDVPASATSLLFGTILHGNGEVTASHLRLTLIAPSAKSKVAPALVLNAAIRQVRSNALHARDVNWSEVEPQIRAMAIGAKESNDVYPAIRALLKALGDHHSLVMEPLAAHQELTEGSPGFEPVVRLESNSIGYIEMPSFMGTDPAARRVFVDDMVEKIGSVAPQVRRGWIVDLREDHGGNMYPMLGGLRPLLGDKPVGGFRDVRGRIFPFAARAAQDKPLTPDSDLQKMPVALITGPHTASSGEAVVVAFEGRKMTRSFGMPTAGLSTSNRGFALPDGGLIFLTTAVDVDRTGHAYGGSIMPDQVVANGDDKTDAALAAATAWLIHRPSGS